MKQLPKKLVTLSALASASLCGFPAYAQTPPSKSPILLEEVVVTARRSEENIQSVPISITAFTGADLERNNIRSAEDIQTISPGIYLGGSGGRQNVIYSVRGQGKALSGPSSAAVIPYFAEVPELTWGANVPEYDLASVEVLKGPQGTLFGRNTLGGAVLYTPNPPTHELGGNFSAGAGNYNNRDFRGAINIPIIADKLAVRIAGFDHNRDGWADDIGTNRDLEDINASGGRISVLYDPTDNISNTLIGDYYEARENGFESYLYNVIPDESASAAIGVGPSLEVRLAEQQARDLYTVSYSNPQFSDNTRWGITDKFTVSFKNDLQLVNIFGYRNGDLKYNTNVDGISLVESTFVPGLPIKYLYADLYDKTEQYTEEIQLRGTSFDGKLEWLTGLFYLKSEPDGVGGNLVAFGAPLVPPSSGYNFTSQTSKAAFVSTRYDLENLLDGLVLNAGIRFTKDKTSSCTGSAPESGLYDLDDCKQGDGLTNTAIIKSKSDSPTWNFGFDWQINPELFTYIVTRRGYRAGGANGPTLTGELAPYQTFKPDNVTDVELGMRSDIYLGDALLRTNVSVFSGEYDDVQTPVQGLSAFFDPAPAGGTLLVNAGKTEVSGVDFMVTLAPSENWVFDVGGTIIDPKTKDISVPDLLRPFLGNPNEIPFNAAAKKTFTGSVTYQRSLRDGLGDLMCNLAYYYNGKMEFSAQEVPDYEIFQARVAWTNIARSGFGVAVWGKNLSDNEYYSGGVASGDIGIYTVMVGAPQTYGVEVLYDF
jgi:iron complex outermembrane receptor protein